MQSQINEIHMLALKKVISYAGDVDDWLTIKKELLKILPSEERKLFSTRDPVTKLQRMNDFEENLICVWLELKKTAI